VGRSPTRSRPKGQASPAARRGARLDAAPRGGGAGVGYEQSSARARRTAGSASSARTSAARCGPPESAAALQANRAPQSSGRPPVERPPTTGARQSSEPSKRCPRGGLSRVWCYLHRAASAARSRTPFGAQAVGADCRFGRADDATGGGLARASCAPSTGTLGMANRVEPAARHGTRAQ